MSRDTRPAARGVWRCCVGGAAGQCGWHGSGGTAAAVSARGVGDGRVVLPFFREEVGSRPVIIAVNAMWGSGEAARQSFRPPGKMLNAI